MHATDTPANLISLGAIDFGIIIDSTVIVMENIQRHLTAPSRFTRTSVCASCAQRRKSDSQCCSRR